MQLEKKIDNHNVVKNEIESENIKVYDSKTNFILFRVPCEKQKVIEGYFRETYSDDIDSKLITNNLMETTLNCEYASLVKENGVSESIDPIKTEFDLLFKDIEKIPLETVIKIEGMVSSLDQTDKLAEISTPYLDALCQKASWPSDLTVLSSSGLCMELKETSRSLTPFLLNRDNIGHKINLPLSAVGRAYLAFCDENECTTILANLRKSQNLPNKLIHNEEKFLNDLNKIRGVGYATREPAFGGGQKPLRSEFDDGLNAIAVPIQLDKRVLGCISLVWLRKAVPVQDIIREYLIDLQNASREISDQFSE